MINSQLVEATDSDVDSDTETSAYSDQQRSGTRISREDLQSLKPIYRYDLADRLRQHIPAIRAVQALEKAKFYTPNDDFQSVLFNKFVTNSKLERYVDQVCDSTPRVSHVATQTDFLPQRMLASVEEELQSSNGSRESSSFRSQFGRRSNYSATNSFDAESVLSNAYCDIHFTDICSQPVISDDNSSVDALDVARPRPNASSSEHAAASSLSSSIYHRPDRPQLTGRPRPKSYQGSVPIQRHDSSAAVLLPPPPSTRPHCCGSYRRIGSLPTCFQRSFSQSASPFELKELDKGAG